MKTIVIAVSAVVLAISAQAASFNWKSSSAVSGANIDAVVGNNSVGNGSATMKSQGSWTAILAIYSGETLVGQSAATTVKWSTTGNKFNTSNITVDGVESGTTYDYVLTITGAPAALTGKVDSNWDYSGASISTTLSGSITTESLGATTLTSANPSLWKVSGAVPAAIPEPTSGLLLLLGVAGLALKRKVA